MLGVTVLGMGFFTLVFGGKTSGFFTENAIVKKLGRNCCQKTTFAGGFSSGMAFFGFFFGFLYGKAVKKPGRGKTVKGGFFEF